jgi:hypothetical protein
VAGLFVAYEQFAAPGGVEHKRLETPATLAEWQTQAATAVKEKGNFVEVTTKKDAASNKSQTLLINVNRVLDVLQE